MMRRIDSGSVPPARHEGHNETKRATTSIISLLTGSNKKIMELDSRAEGGGAYDADCRPEEHATHPSSERR